MKRRRLVHVAAILACLTGSVANAQTPDKPQPVPVTFKIEDNYKEADLVGREGNVLYYRPRGGPEGASVTLKLDTIAEGEFDLKYDREAVGKALIGERWTEAATLLIPVVTPLLPYLDINENNGLALAMDTAMSLIKAARPMATAEGATKDKVSAVYKRAYAIFKSISKAPWSPDAELAALRAVECLVSIGDLAQAEQELAATREPAPGDESYGLYWLVKSSILYAKKKTRDAMHAAVKSVVFDNKNIETFPDALFMTGRCYEDLLEWYRARDVYFEIARLFPATSHAKTAREKLAFLMEKGLTKNKEESPIESVFFGLDEDVNEKVRALLKSEDKATDAPDKTEIEDDAEAEAEAALKKAEQKKKAEQGEPPQ